MYKRCWKGKKYQTLLIHHRYEPSILLPICSRNFTEAHLGKIKAVYPEAYEFSRERVKVPFSNEVTYELMIERLPHSSEFFFSNF